MMLENPELTLNYVSYHSYVDPIDPDVEMLDGDVITLGNTSIRIVTTPGHTAGCISLFFDVVDNGISYIAGMHGGVGLNTLDKSFTDKFGQIYSKNEFINSMDKVMPEPVDIVLGNHTIQNNTLYKREKLLKEPDSTNPFINRTEWKSFLNEVKSIFYQLSQNNI
jgi:metallo-beta-lactamase class B